MFIYVNQFYISIIYILLQYSVKFLYNNIASIFIFLVSILIVV